MGIGIPDRLNLVIESISCELDIGGVILLSVKNLRIKKRFLKTQL